MDLIFPQSLLYIYVFGNVIKLYTVVHYLNNLFKKVMLWLLKMFHITTI